MRTITPRRLNEPIPVLGQGTWRMGRGSHDADVRALQLGIDLGMTLLDTAEMYTGAEEVVRDAITGRRDALFIVSKVLPSNASRTGTIEACERSLKRLGIDRLDLYLLHWPGPHPLNDTLAAFVELRDAGKIRYFGVSNFDIDPSRRLDTLPHGDEIVTNQVYYNVRRRGIERNVVPFTAATGQFIMAYTPLESGALGRSTALANVAERHGVKASTIAIAWTMRHPHVIAIPKATQPDHVRDNAAAADVALTDDDLAEIDREFLPPSRDVPLETT